MKTILLAMILTASLAAKGQSISMETISSSGTFYNQSVATLSFTGGEATSGTFSSGNKILTQGFEQAYHTYWVGTVSTAWENPLNWNGPFPGIHTDVIILGGKPNNPIVNSMALCRRVIINPGAIVTVNTAFKLSISK